MAYVKNLDIELWKEAKAEARLEGITIKEWLERTISHSLVGSGTLRRRLPEQAKCEMCGRVILKNGQAKDRIIAHHDKPNNRKASVVKLLCSHCHIERHRQLGWGISYLPKKATRSNKFRCSLCSAWYPVSARAPVEVKAHTRLCLYCWRDRKEEASEFLKPLRNWNEKRGRPPKKVIYPVSNTIRDGEKL